VARRINPTWIGAFILGALALTVGAVLLVGGRDWLKRPVTCVIAFDGSVSGLTIGAPVRFRGVPLGTVADIQLRYGAPQVVVVTEIDPSRIQGLRADLQPADVDRILTDAVQKGLRAQLQLQSLITGQLFVGLDFAPETPVRLSGPDHGRCEIPTIPTTLAQVQEQLKKALAGVEQLPLKQTLDSVARAGAAIEQVASAPELRRILGSSDRSMREVEKLVHTLNGRVDPLVGNIQATLNRAQRTLDEVGGDVRRLVNDVDAKVTPLAGSVGGAADSVQALMQDGRATLRQLDEQIAPTMTALRRAGDSVQDAMRKAEGTFGRADAAFDGNSSFGYQLAQALEQLTRTAQELRNLSEDVQRQPNLWLFGRRGGRNP
jgi:paraquat-inducible protein B